MPMWHFEPFMRSPAGDKNALHLEGAVHRSFTGRQLELSDPRPEREILRWICAETLAFRDLHLKNADAAKPWLEPERVSELISELSGGNSEVGKR